MSSPYSGSLQRKTKAELQEIAQALSVSDVGTKDDLQQRIKRHLDNNSDDLEGDPIFAGLYSRRRRQGSIQPATAGAAAHSVNGVAAHIHTRASDASHFETIAEEKEPSPVPGGIAAFDARDVSMMLPHAPASPARVSLSSARNSPILRRLSPAPSSPALGAPPVSVSASPAKSIIADAMAQPEVVAAVQMQRNFAGNLVVALAMTRNSLSNGSNLFVLSSLIDILAILFTVHGSSSSSSSSEYPVPIQTTVLALTHWAMPSVVLPAILGYLISFSSFSLSSTTASHSRNGATSISITSTFDPLSAAIIKAAGAAAYPYPSMIFVPSANEIRSLDVLGAKWRAVSAGVTLAFAFAEAIVNAGTGAGAGRRERRGVNGNGNGNGVDEIEL